MQINLINLAANYSKGLKLYLKQTPSQHGDRTYSLSQTPLLPLIVKTGGLLKTGYKNMAIKTGSVTDSITATYSKDLKLY